MNWIKKKGDFTQITIHVVPRASKSEIVGIYNGALKIKLISPPIDDKANKELIGLLSNKLKISKSHISIISGSTQRKKTLNIKECDTQIIISKLDAG